MHPAFDQWVGGPGDACPAMQPGSCPASGGREGIAVKVRVRAVLQPSQRSQQRPGSAQSAGLQDAGM